MGETCVLSCIAFNTTNSSTHHHIVLQRNTWRADAGLTVDLSSMKAVSIDAEHQEITVQGKAILYMHGPRPAHVAELEQLTPATTVSQAINLQLLHEP